MPHRQVKPFWSCSICSIKSRSANGRSITGTSSLEALEHEIAPPATRPRQRLLSLADRVRTNLNPAVRSKKSHYLFLANQIIKHVSRNVSFLAVGENNRYPHFWFTPWHRLFSHSDTPPDIKHTYLQHDFSPYPLLASTQFLLMSATRWHAATYRPTRHLPRRRSEECSRPKTDDTAVKNFAHPTTMSSPHGSANRGGWRRRRLGGKKKMPPCLPFKHSVLRYFTNKLILTDYK